MTGDEAKRHLLNYMVYSHGYLTMAQGELSAVDPVRLCEQASHAMACMWALADALFDGTLTPGDLSRAMNQIANRWVKAVEKWSKAIDTNRARAYAAPIAERKALQQWPQDTSATV